MKRWLATDKATGLTWMWTSRPKKDKTSFVGDERGIQKIQQEYVEFKLPSWEDSPIEVEITITPIKL